MWKVKMRWMGGLLLIPVLFVSACGGQNAPKAEVLLYEESEDAAEGVSGSAVSGSALDTEEEFKTTTVRKTTYKEEFQSTVDMEYTDTDVLIIDDEDAVLDEVKVKKDQKVKKGDVLAVYHVETSKTKLQKQKLLLDQARADYESGLSGLNQQLSQAKKELQNLEKQAEKKMKRLEIEKLEKQISAYKKGEKEVISQEKDYAEILRKQKRTTLVAKRSGVITETGKAYEGEMVDTSMKIIEMRSNDKWVLRVDDPDAKLRYNMDVSIRLGKSVRDYDHEVKGKVITAGDITGQEQQDEEGQNVVYIEVKESDKKRYDFEKSNIYVYAVTFMVKDALVVDAAAVQSESVDISNRLFVYVVENGKLHKRCIVSSYQTDEEYLVEQGVFENQTLAILNG